MSAHNPLEHDLEEYQATLDILDQYLTHDPQNAMVIKYYQQKAAKLYSLIEGYITEDDTAEEIPFSEQYYDYMED